MSSNKLSGPIYEATAWSLTNLFHMHYILTSEKLVTPPKQPVGTQMSQSSNLPMLTVHKIYVCNCLFLFLLFLSFLSHFLHRIFFHFFSLCQNSFQLFSKIYVPCHIYVSIWHKRALRAEAGPGLAHPYCCPWCQY